MKKEIKVKKKTGPVPSIAGYGYNSNYNHIVKICIFNFTILRRKKIIPFLSHLAEKKYFSLLLVLSLLAVQACSGFSSGSEPRAIKGVLDLKQWDFSQQGTVRLDGQWEFYWKRLIDPGKADTVRPVEEPAYIQVPSWWTGFPSGSTRLPSEGFGSYRLKILLPEGGPPLSFKFMNIHTAHRAYVNGRLVSSRGTVGETASASVPDVIYCVSDLIVHEPVLDLVVHVSNFNHHGGGIFISQILGPESEIHRDNDIKLAINFFLFGSIIIIGFYYFMLYILHREDVAYLLFCLFCILIALRIIVTGNVDYSNWPVHLSWDFIYHMAIVTFFIALPVFSLYLHLLYPGEFPRPILYGLLAIGTLFTITGIFTGSMFLSRLVSVYDVIVLGAAAYMTYVVILALIRKRQGSVIFFTGFLTILFTIINDILHDSMIIQTAFISPFGLFAFILFQIILLSQRFRNSYISLKTMGSELKKNNDHLLEVLIDLKETQELLIRQEKKTAVGSLASGLAHEIKNQLHSLSVLEFMKDRFNEEDSEYIRYILESRDRISSMVDEVRALGKEEESSFTLSPVSLSLIVKETLVLIKIDPEVKNRHIMIAEHFSGEVMADKNKIIQVLLNLMRNAAHAIDGMEKGIITLRTDLENGRAIIQITDTGKGIEADMLQKIWEPFFTTKGENGTGLGLHICRRIVEGHGGTIGCTSEKGSGTTFSFTLPLARPGGRQ